MTNYFSRRGFVSGASAFVIVGSGNANAFCKICALSRLTPQRFVAGLVFDVARAVLVRTASDWIVTKILTGSYSSSSTYNVGYYKPEKVISEASFDLNAYKAAIVTLGIVDFEVQRQKRIELLLQEADTDSLKRLSEVRGYLQAEKISIRTYYDQLSYPVSSETTFDELLSIRYFDITDDQKEKHIKQMIDATGVTVFNGWS